MSRAVEAGRGRLPRLRLLPGCSGLAPPVKSRWCASSRARWSWRSWGAVCARKGAAHSASDSTLPKIKGQPRQKGGRPSKGNKAAAKAPVVMEERHPDPKVVDKWQAGNFPKQQIAVPQEKTRPGSGKRGGSVRRAG